MSQRALVSPSQRRAAGSKTADGHQEQPTNPEPAGVVGVGLAQRSHENGNSSSQNYDPQSVAFQIEGHPNGSLKVDGHLTNSLSRPSQHTNGLSPHHTIHLSVAGLSGKLREKLHWRERIRHFTWTFFTITMATGGIANVLREGMRHPTEASTQNLTSCLLHSAFPIPWTACHRARILSAQHRHFPLQRPHDDPAILELPGNVLGVGAASDRKALCTCCGRFLRHNLVEHLSVRARQGRSLAERRGRRTVLD